MAVWNRRCMVEIGKKTQFSSRLREKPLRYLTVDNMESVYVDSNDIFFLLRYDNFEV